MRKAVLQFLAITILVVCSYLFRASGQNMDHDLSVSAQAQSGQTTQTDMQGMNMSQSAVVDAFVRRFLGHGMAAGFSF